MSCPSRTGVCVSTAALVVAVLALGAVGGIELTLPNGTVADASVDEPGEPDVYRCRVPEGARVSVTVKAVKRKGETSVRPQLSVLAGGEVLAETTARGRRARVKKLLAPGGDDVVVQVTGADGTSGPYAVAVKWKPRKRVRADVDLDGDGTTVVLPAAPGSVATLSVAARKGSAAFPRIAAIRPGETVPEAPSPGARAHRVKKLRLAEGIVHEVDIANDGAAGAVRFTAKLKSSRPLRARVDASGATLRGDPEGGGGPDELVVGIVGPDGGSVGVGPQFDDAHPGEDGIAGSRIDIEAALLPRPTAVAIGPGADPLDPPIVGLLRAGPTVFFGPPAALFPAPVDITIPFDAGLLRGREDLLVVYRRDADGAVTEVPGPYVIDAERGLVTFSVLQLASFRAFAPILELQEAGRQTLEHPTDPSSGYGHAIALQGDTMLIGDFSDDDDDTDAGAVFVYQRVDGAWTFDRRIAHPEPEHWNNAGFGRSLLLSGDTLFVGAPFILNAELIGGAVYVFERDGDDWTLVQRLVDPDPRSLGELGFSLALDGDVLVAGASGRGTAAAFRSGTALVYRRSDSTGDWDFESYLLGTDLERDQQFGQSVAVLGDVAVVGGEGTLDVGNARVFRHAAGVWTEEAALATPDVALDEDHGSAVALEPGRAFVADRSWQDGGTTSGRVHMYRDDGGGQWIYDGFIPAPEIDRGGSFGQTLVLDGDRLAIAAPGVDVNGRTGAGRVYLFERVGGDWAQLFQADATSPSTLENFGEALALDGLTLAAGAEGFSSADEFVEVLDLRFAPGGQ